MDGPFRIRKPLPESTLRGSPRSSTPDEHWMQRLTKLIPAEVLAVYLAGKAYAEHWLGIWSVICLCLVVVIRAWGTRDPKKPPQWIAVVVATLSFIVWVYAMGDHLLSLRLQDPGIASAAVLVWTVIVPILYKGD